MKALAELVVDPGRIVDERGREVDGGELRRAQIGLALVELGDEVLVESVVLGNCRAQGQSGVAVVIRRTAQADQLRRDRVDAVVADGGSGEAHERAEQLAVGACAGCDACRAQPVHDAAPGPIAAASPSSRVMRCSTTSRAFTNVANPSSPR